MLAGAISYVALIGVIAMTVLSAGMLMSRITIARLAQSYTATGYQRAAAALQTTLASDVQNGMMPSPTSTIAPIAPACADARCKYLTRESAVFTTMSVSTPPPGIACDVQQTNCAANEEANGYVNESRLTARITVTITDPNNNVLTMRSGDVVFRTFRTPPYVAVVGSRDGSFDDVAGADAAGDDGGLPPATPDPCNANSGTTDDTTIRVAYRNTQTSACSDGSSWRDGSYSQHGASASGWSP